MSIYNLLLLIIHLSTKFTRLFFLKKSGLKGIKNAIKKNKIDTFIVFLSYYINEALIILFLFFSKSFTIGFLPFPGWIKIYALFIGGAEAFFYFYIHIFLDRNLSFTLEIKEDHTLIQTGPYKYIRHPMYISLIIRGIFYFLITSNVIIFLNWFISIAIVLYLRIPKEEQMMLDKFPEQYKAYKKKTGMLLPKIRKF